jgi:predicted GNAT family acetyltransferase
VPAIDVRDVPDRDRFEGVLEGDVVAILDYRRRDDGVLLLTHAEVAPAVGGRGVGTAFVKGALDDLRARGATVQPICGFVRAVIRDHPEYRSLVA